MNDTSLFPRLTWEAITLQLRNPFRIAYGVSETRQAFWLRLANDEGWGEGTIPSYYGISDEAMTAEPAHGDEAAALGRHRRQRHHEDGDEVFRARAHVGVFR